MKRKILIINPYYFPGFKSGGPQQTVKNIVDVFGKQYDIRILTLNHDYGENRPYSDIGTGWNQVGNAKVLYLSEKQFSLNAIRSIASKVELVYACGLFETTTVKSIIAKRLGLFNCRLVVAPMGVFSEKAIQWKWKKKIAFLKTFKAIGAFNKITWSFSSELEKQDMEKYVHISDYVIAEDLPRKLEPWAIEALDKINESGEFINNRLKKVNGELRIIFLGRIEEHKNLFGALEILNQKWTGKLLFDIYGIKQDKEYWKKCQKYIDGMDSTVMVKYCGEVKPENVPQIFSMYDVLLFPTKGENFAHVIFEALSAGCIPVISDQTIWNDLEDKMCGFVNGLDDVNGFRSSLETLLNMSSDLYTNYSKNAIKYAYNRYMLSVRSSEFKKIFDNELIVGGVQPIK